MREDMMHTNLIEQDTLEVAAARGTHGVALALHKIRK